MKNKKLLAVSMALLLAVTPTFTGCEEQLSEFLVGVLTGFEKAPDPTIKAGRFNFSVTYEVDGEVKTISSVYVCEFKESGMLLGGWYISWNAYIEDPEVQALFQDEDMYTDMIVETNEDGTIYLDLMLNPEYFMNEPGYTRGECRPYMYIKYNEEVSNEKDSYGEDDVEILESYGVKILSYEYDPPLENIYN